MNRPCNRECMHSLYAIVFDHIHDQQRVNIICDLLDDLAETYTKDYLVEMTYKLIKEAL